MNLFGRKLRQFKDTWISPSDPPAQSVRSRIGFLFNADDTPRFWSDDHAWDEPMAEPLTMGFPGFQRRGTKAAALDKIQRRAA